MNPSSVFLACSRCGEMVIKSVNGELKLRTKILLLCEEKGSRAVCRGCGEEIPIPVKLDTDMVKSLAKDASPKLYLRSIKGEGKHTKT
jgi:ribosomal protein S27E